MCCGNLIPKRNDAQAEKRNNAMTLNIKQILEDAYARLGTDAAIGNRTGVDRITIWKLRTGVHKKARSATAMKILRGLGVVQ